MNGPVIFPAKGTKVHLRLRGTNLVTRYVFPEGSCLIPEKAAYMDDEIWVKVGKLVSPGIREMKISNASCVFPILFSTDIILHLCSS